MLRTGNPNKKPNPRIAPPQANKWYALGLLMVVGLFNYIDRLSISILQVPIKAELELSDTQIGILTGLAFSLVYTTMSIPLARLADRVPRKFVIAGALAAWSLMTAACGFASGFVMLAFLRMGVAIGEAGCVPASHSTISDYFPLHERATAIATYGLVFPVGTLIGFAASGWLSTAFGWRQTFIILGLLGLVLVPIVLATLREPARGESDGHAFVGQTLSLRDAVGTLWRSLAMRHLIIGGAILSYPLNASLVWNAAFYDRIFGLPLAELALYLALLSGGGGAIGLYASGLFADRLGRIDARWYMWVPGLAGLLTVPFMFAQYLFAGGAYSSLAMGFASAVLLNAFLAPMAATAQSLAAPNLRALASASIVFTAGFIGTVLGPLLTGIVSDLLALRFDLGSEAIRYAILSSAFVGLLGASLLLRGARYLPDEFARLRTVSSEAESSTPPVRGGSPRRPGVDPQ